MGAGFHGWGSRGRPECRWPHVASQGCRGTTWWLSGRRDTLPPPSPDVGPEATLTVVLGINAYHSSASAALIIDGAVTAAVEEERFTRQKYETGFPHRSIRY